MKRVLVCGGRDYADNVMVQFHLDAIERKYGISCLIQGGARGADMLASVWATQNNKIQEVYSADWEAHGKKAGPLRNKRMLDDGKPDLVLAFPGGRGTADMLRRAKVAGINVIEARP